jgi:hypothetical protein
LNVNRAGGRPKNPLLSKLFDSLCEWLESVSDDELHTLEELRGWMIEGYVGVVGCDDTNRESAYATANEEVYTAKHLKRKLLMRFGDHLFFAAKAGKATFIHVSIASKAYSSKNEFTFIFCFFGE